jgi:hypothetical protein
MKTKKTRHDANSKKINTATLTDKTARRPKLTRTQPQGP